MIQRRDGQNRCNFPHSIIHSKFNEIEGMEKLDEKCFSISFPRFSFFSARKVVGAQIDS